MILQNPVFSSGCEVRRLWARCPIAPQGPSRTGIKCSGYMVSASSHAFVEAPGSLGPLAKASELPLFKARVGFCHLL